VDDTPHCTATYYHVKFLLTYLQNCSSGEYQGTTFSIRILAIIYVICQCPRCNKCEYDGCDYRASCPTEQRHHISP